VWPSRLPLALYDGGYARINWTSGQCVREPWAVAHDIRADLHCLMMVPMLAYVPGTLAVYGTAEGPAAGSSGR
jgi:hypothetical protein